MFDSSGNGPAIPCLRIVHLRANREPDVALDEVSRLLVLMSMAWQDRALVQSKLGHEHFLAMDQGLSLDSFQGQVIASAAELFEHAVFLAVAAS